MEIFLHQEGSQPLTSPSNLFLPLSRYSLVCMAHILLPQLPPPYSRHHGASPVTIPNFIANSGTVNCRVVSPWVKIFIFCLKPSPKSSPSKRQRTSFLVSEQVWALNRERSACVAGPSLEKPERPRFVSFCRRSAPTRRWFCRKVQGCSSSRDYNPISNNPRPRISESTPTAQHKNTSNHVFLDEQHFRGGGSRDADLAFKIN